LPKGSAQILRLAEVELRMAPRHNVRASRLAVGPSHISIVIVICVSVMACAAFAPAQTRDLGSIEGIVTDPSGAVVAGAAVRARIVQTSVMVSGASAGDL
jgi:hypothetical protein